jgi:hypothetical protein
MQLGVALHSRGGEVAGSSPAAACHQHADPPHAVRLLRAHRERPRRRTADKRNELASPHWPFPQAKDNTLPRVVRYGKFRRRLAAMGHFRPRRRTLPRGPLPFRPES